MVRYSADPDIAGVAALIGDPARAQILFALLAGGARSAGDLADGAGVSPSAASAHLAKLLAGGLLSVERAGRRRLYRLTGPDVAAAMESLAALAKPVPIRALTQGTIASHLRAARSCYDHLAGRLGVAVTDRLIARAVIVPKGRGDFRVTGEGERFFAALEIDVERVRASRRHFARACMDWSERRPHLAGALGAALLERFLANDWCRYRPSSRGLLVTECGRRALAERLGVDARAA